MTDEELLDKLKRIALAASNLESQVKYLRRETQSLHKAVVLAQQQPSLFDQEQGGET